MTGIPRPGESLPRHAADVHPTVAARFADLGGARDAIKALENAGIDGDEIELLGRPAQLARAPADPKITDRRVALYLGQRILRGAGFGALAGVVPGVVVGAVLLAASGAATGVLVACGLGGAFLGATLGAFVSLERSIGLSDDWALTFQDAPTGPIWVGVYSRDPDGRARARRVLAGHQPLELREAPDGPR